VTEEKIRQEIIENNLTTAKQVTNYTKAGGGCGGCIPEIEQILAEIAVENKDEDQGPVSAMLAGRGNNRPLSSMSNLQKMKLIVDTIETDIIPELKKHGGDMELVDIEDNKVLVKLKGACTDCGMTRFTIQTIVAPKLKEKVSSELEVLEA
jgi:NifU-like protein